MKNTIEDRFIWRPTLRLACCAALAACDGGGGGSNANPPPTGPTGPVATQIQAMEDQGKLPKLDRSTEIKGPDVNNDGVRDDVETYVHGLPLSVDQKHGLLMQSHSIQQALLVDVKNKGALQESVNAMANDVRCAFSLYIGDAGQREKDMVKVKSVTLNTRERSKRWVEWNQAIRGMSSPISEPEQKKCAK